jgi:Kef-type K+ transport system membrane component KefB
LGAQIMEIVYFTLVAIGLYFLSDWLLDRLEAARGRPFENRSVIFFVIILVLAIVSFQIIGQLMRS